jgi:hypothetical protein
MPAQVVSRPRERTPSIIIPNDATFRRPGTCLPWRQATNTMRLAFNAEEMFGVTIQELRMAQRFNAG